MILHAVVKFVRQEYHPMVCHSIRLLFPQWWGIVSISLTLFSNLCSWTANTDAPPRKFRKGDRTRRIWSVREEEILAASMLELLARGWKSDNGFRTGYLGKIEDSLRKEFPNTDLKGTPHITSKISAWKKSYTSLSKILARSGVGFNSDGQYMIECDDDQWEAIVQVFNIFLG